MIINLSEFFDKLQSTWTIKNLLIKHTWIDTHRKEIKILKNSLEKITAENENEAEKQEMNSYSTIISIKWFSGDTLSWGYRNSQHI